MGSENKCSGANQIPYFSCSCGHFTASKGIQTTLTGRRKAYCRKTWEQTPSPRTANCSLFLLLWAVIQLLYWSGAALVGALSSFVMKRRGNIKKKKLKNRYIMNTIHSSRLLHIHRCVFYMSYRADGCTFQLCISFLQWSEKKYGWRTLRMFASKVKSKR